MSFVLALEDELTKDQLAEKGKWAMENYEDKDMMDKDDYGNMHYGMMGKRGYKDPYSMLGFGIVKLLCIAAITFMVSVIFWLTHNWLVKKK